jgi:hypothetical protein
MEKIKEVRQETTNNRTRTTSLQNTINHNFKKTALGAAMPV